MASRPTRDNTAHAKEKRVPSPSNIPTTTTTMRGRSPNPPKKPAFPARTHNPTTSEKSVPNYLKATMSSVDVSKQQGKKPVTKTESGTTPKSTLARRRSFDKPASTSQSQISRVSPSPTLRPSSSFSGKITGPQKSVHVRNSKMPKEVGKQHTLYARPVTTVKKIYIKKSDMRVNSSTAKEKVVVTHEEVKGGNMHDVPEPKMQFEGQETIPIDDVIEKGEKDYSSPKNQEPISYEQIVNLEFSTISEPIVETENKDAKSPSFESSHQEPVKIEQNEGKSEHKDNIEDSVIDDQEPVDIKQIEEDNENNDSDIENLELTGNTKHENDKVENVEPLDINESKDIKQDDGLIEDNINDVSYMINNNDESAAGNDISENVEEKKIEEEVEAEAEIGWSKKDEAASDGEAHETDKKEVEVVVEKKAETTENNEVAKVQMAHGKKEIPVSNGVIEETASKLREQRKNKVRALAGAFETVISLQDK